MPAYVMITVNTLIIDEMLKSIRLLRVYKHKYCKPNTPGMMVLWQQWHFDMVKFTTLNSQIYVMKLFQIIIWHCTLCHALPVYAMRCEIDKHITRHVGRLLICHVTKFSTHNTNYGDIIWCDELVATHSTTCGKIWFVEMSIHNNA